MSLVKQSFLAVFAVRRQTVGSFYTEYNQAYRPLATCPDSVLACSSASEPLCHLEDMLRVALIGAGVHSRCWSRVGRRFRRWDQCKFCLSCCSRLVRYET